LTLLRFSDHPAAFEKGNIVATCASCRYFVPTKNHPDVTGTCHRYPPSGSGVTFIPLEWWCGEFDKRLAAPDQPAKMLAIPVAAAVDPASLL
jgi:hypothetical protein